MSTAVLENFNLDLDFDQIEQKVQNLPRGSSDFSEFNLQKKYKASSKFEILAQILNGVADSVSKDWSKFKPEEREVFKSIAYGLIAKPKNKASFPGFISKVRFHIQFFILKLKGEEQAVLTCFEALDRLVDNILDLIEQEDPLYQQVIVDTLEELRTNS